MFVVSLLVASCGGGHGLARELVEVTLTPSPPSIAAGTSVQLSATGRFSDDTTEDLTTQVAWTSATAWSRRSETASQQDTTPAPA